MSERATVTISGSYRKHLDRILDFRSEFEALGARVLRPHTDRVVDAGDSLVRLDGDPQAPAQVQRAQLQAIDRSTLLYVVNPGGYVGPSATVEVGWAARLGITIVTAEPAFEDAVANLVHAVGSPRHALDLAVSAPHLGLERAPGVPA